MQNFETDIAIIKTDVSHIKAAVDRIETTMFDGESGGIVQKVAILEGKIEGFSTVKMLSYIGAALAGAVGLILGLTHYFEVI